MKNYSLVCLLFFIFSIANAQIGGVEKEKRDEIPLLKERGIKVAISDDDEMSREMWRTAMDKVWAFTDSYDLGTVDEYRSLLKKNAEAKNYSVLSYNRKELPNNVPGNTIAIRLGEKKVYTHYINVSFFDEKLNLANLMLAIGRLQNDLNDEPYDGKTYESKQMAKVHEIKEQLKVKTLLIDRDLIDDKGLNLLKSDYPYKFKVTNKSELEQAFVEQNKDYLLIMPIKHETRPSTTGLRNKDKPFGLGLHTTRNMSYEMNAIISAGKSQVLSPFTMTSGKIVKEDIKKLLAIVAL